HDKIVHLLTEPNKIKQKQKMNTIQKTQAINIELPCFNNINNNRKLSVSDTIKILLKRKALLIMICFCEKSHEIN
ncbi:MAG: hypothetical protein SOX76_02990, partial [Candidatus Enterosoma sp.]|nr:hypothetical protein [Candidatus Enterosoma sp.]